MAININCIVSIIMVIIFVLNVQPKSELNLQFSLFVLLSSLQTIVKKVSFHLIQGETRGEDEQEKRPEGMSLT